MPTLQINIISEQTIPNILFIKQFEGETDGYIFVSTDRMNRDGQLQNIIAVCQIPQTKYRIVTVSEESLADVETQLEALQLPRTDKYIVNITGGTKIMSIGVYDFFSRRNSEIYYIPIGTNQYKRIFPPANEETLQLSYRATLPQYLTAYGISVTNLPAINTLIQPPAVTQKLLTAPYNVSSQPIKNLRTYETNAIAAGTPILQLPLTTLPASLVYLPNLLRYIGFVPHAANVLNANEIHYLLGQWLEEYVYNFIRHEYPMSDECIGKSVEIERKGVKNELDVMFTHNNTLYVIECKTNLTKAIFDQTAYKLTAIRKEFGLFVKSAIVCLNNLNDFTGRLKLFDIKLYNGTVSKNKNQFATELHNFIK